MKITLKNIGVFKQAEYELGDLTIICGENNTGKTYATYSLYGFFDFWKFGFSIKRPDSEISKLMEDGSLSIQLDQINIKAELDRACKQYSKLLPQIFAASEKLFEASSFQIELDDKDISILDVYNRRWRTAKSEMMQISKEEGKNEISVSLLVDTNEIDTTSIRLNLSNAISEALKEIIFGRTFSDIFIASAERTGAVIFKNDLNFEQSRLIKEIAVSNDVDLDEILNKVYNSSYALPVKRNIDFIRRLEEVSKSESFILKNHPDLLTDFADIIGGEYKIGRDGLYYSPKSGRGIKLTMGESSSSVRSLLDVGFYLRHVAGEGDILMIDEPELNLHPCNQRKLAKLFARLVNIGVKVFITTHSDYIVKELNTLIMLDFRKDYDNMKHIMHRSNYKDSELIGHERIKVFISEQEKVKVDGNSRKSTIQTLVPAVIDESYGIEARSFDKTINDMNQIQESIILGRS